jgi:TolA-binding protein
VTKFGQFFALCLVISTACGGRQTPATPADPAASTVSQSTQQTPNPELSEDKSTNSPEAPQVINLEPIRLEVVRGDSGEPEVIAFDARSLFDAGNEALVEGKLDEALEQYNKLLADFPDSKLAVPAMYNSALALEGKGDFDGAIARYRDLTKRSPTTRDSIDAQIRSAAVLAELERWTDAVATLDELLKRKDLTASDRIEGMARRGYVMLEAKDFTGAEKVLREALAHYEQIKADVHLETDYFLGMAKYYLGQIPHRQFSAIPLRLPDDQIARDIEAKAELVLIAHDRYSETIDHGNIYWASAAGFQIATMNHEFWTALVTAPIPPQLSPKEAELYVKEVHKQGRQFLERAIEIHGKTVKLAEVYKTTTPWSEASRQRAGELTDILARETAGELVKPDAEPQKGPVGEPLSSPATYVPSRIGL